MVPLTNVAVNCAVGDVVVPYNNEYVGVGVPVIPAASNVTLIVDDVGDPVTTGIDGADDGGVTGVPPVVIGPDTALDTVPYALVATDLK